MSYLLDTNVVSEIRRGRSPQVAAWAHGLERSDAVYLSVLTLGEIRRGIELLRDRDLRQATAFESWLTQLRAQFASRLLPITAEVADRWGRIAAIRTVGAVDSLIAATAHVHGLTVATRNVRDFDGLGVDIVNPWSA